MRKSYLFLLFVLMFAITFDKLQADYAKFPLMERFTNASCGPCASYNESGYSNWVAANHNKLAIISYQVSWPGTDPMYTFNRDLPNTRVSFYNAIDLYGVVGVPSVAFNGVLVGYPQSNGSLDSRPSNGMLDTLLERESAKRSPMQVTPTLEIVDGVAKISVAVTSEEAMNNIRLQVLIVQSVCDYEIAPGSNGERIFPYVARYALPSINGTSFTIEANNTLTFPFEQALSSTLTKQQRLYVVAFVEPSNSSEGNHSIIQAGMSVAAVPMPTIVDLKPGYNILYNFNRIYAKATKGAEMAHTLTLKNSSNYDVVVDVAETELDEGWELAASAVPAETPTLLPTEQIQITNKVKYIGETPSCLINEITATVSITDEELSQLQLEDDFIALSAVIQIPYIDVSSNTKHAYIPYMASGDISTASAFQNATYFKKEPGNTLVSIPYLILDLFKTDILDSLEFLGMTTAGATYLMEDIYYDGSTVVNKLRALNKTKLFFGIDGLTYNYSKTYAEGYYESAAFKASDKFLSDMFGVNVSEAPYAIATVNEETDQYLTNEITGADEEISPALPKFNINTGESAKNRYIAYFDVLSANTKPVYTAMTNLHPIDAVAHAVPVMAKYQNNDMKRFIVGFNFATLPYVPAESSISNVANAIIDWMFPSNFIEDGETNLSTKNGILLSTYPNPVTSVSNLIVHNTNDMPVSAKVYLLDVSGKMVMALFDGTLPIGNNNIELSNSNISTGTYFVVTETAAGKTYMSIAMSK